MRNTCFKTFLEEEFDFRKSENPMYSLRAYARDLDIRPSQLSDILNDKAGLGKKKALTIAKNLKLSEKETKVFLAMVDAKFGKSPRIIKEANEFLAQHAHAANFKGLGEEGFKFISDWIYYGILSTMELDDYNGSLEFVARSLKVDKHRIEDAIKVLLKLDLIDLQDSKFVISGEMFTSTHDISSSALKRFHKQHLRKSMDAIDEVAIELRDITTMTMAIDVDKIPEAKEKIKDFRRSLCRLLESGPKKEVYNLNIQLIPLQEVKTNEAC